MEKLKLKHLAPYLPYGLSFAYKMLGSKPFAIAVMKELNAEQVNKQYFVEHEVLPLLLPLSEVTKHQWESVFMAGIDDVVLDVIKSYYLADVHVKEKVIRYYDTAKGIHLKMPVDTLFVINLNPLQFESGQNHNYRFYMLRAIDMMNKLHIDYMHLIDKGLALNKLDYEK